MRGCQLPKKRLIHSRVQLINLVHYIEWTFGNTFTCAFAKYGCVTSFFTCVKFVLIAWSLYKDTVKAEQMILIFITLGYGAVQLKKSYSV